MSTHPIGSGTSNVAVNMLMEERAILRKLAFQQDVSTSELIRSLVRIALHQQFPAEVGTLFEARHQGRHVIAPATGLMKVSQARLPGAGSSLDRKPERAPVRIQKWGDRS